LIDAIVSEMMSSPTRRVAIPQLLLAFSFAVAVFRVFMPYDEDLLMLSILLGATFALLLKTDGILGRRFDPFKSKEPMIPGADLDNLASEVLSGHRNVYTDAIVRTGRWKVIRSWGPLITARLASYYMLLTVGILLLDRFFAFTSGYDLMRVLASQGLGVPLALAVSACVTVPLLDLGKVADSQGDPHDQNFQTTIMLLDRYFTGNVATKLGQGETVVRVLASFVSIPTINKTVDIKPIMGFYKADNFLLTLDGLRKKGDISENDGKSSQRLFEAKEKLDALDDVSGLRSVDLLRAAFSLYDEKKRSKHAMVYRINPDSGFIIVTPYAGSIETMPPPNGWKEPAKPIVKDRPVFFVFGYGKSSAIESLRLSLALEEDRLFNEKLLPKARHLGNR